MCLKKIIQAAVLIVAIVATVNAATPTVKSIYYEVPEKTVGSVITAHILVNSPYDGKADFRFEVVKNNPFGWDYVIGELYRTYNLSSGDNMLNVSFIAPDTGDLFLRVYYLQGNQWVRLDPWQILSLDRPDFKIQLDIPAIENSRTITSLPYSIVDTVTYRIRWDSKYGGPVYCDRYYLNLQAGQKININVRSLNGKTFSVFFYKDDGKIQYVGSTKFYGYTYAPSKSYRAEIRIYPDGTRENLDVVKYELTIKELAAPTPTPTATPTPTPSPTPSPTPTPTSTPTPTQTPVTTPTTAPTQTPSQPTGVPGFEAFFAIAGLLSVAFLLRRKS